MNNIQILEIPKWGLSMEEGTVIEWLIAEGDEFSEGQEICEIESSKIVNVLEAPFAGRLRKIIAAAGDTLPVQAPIGLAAPVDVADADIEAFAAELVSVGQSTSEPKPTKNAVQHNAAPTVAPLDARSLHRPGKVVAIPTSGDVNVPSSLQHGDTDVDVHATPRARVLAEAYGINLNNVTGTGRNQRVSIVDVRNAVDAAGGHLPAAKQYVTTTVMTAASLADDTSVRATPLARRAARAWGVNLNDCRPSGRNGRVIKADVEAARSRVSGPSAVQSQSAESDIEPLPDTDLKFTDTPLSSMRKTIGNRLKKSKEMAPHYRLTIDCRLDALLSLRKQINAENPAAKVSVNDFLIKAAAMALIEVPACNIQFNGEVVRHFNDAHVSVAVALESGLITPIVRAANTKGVVEISNETKSLVTRAKANTLKADDFQGGTFTVSNLGMFGISYFDAIINPPQAAILAIGAGESRVVVDQGKTAIATLVTVTLSSDHRVIDGALGSKWLNAFREFVEKPARMLS